MLLTVSTITGKGQAQNIDTPVTWFPFDSRRIVRRFIGELRPRALLLVETELWPNVLHEAAQAAVPVALVNGRLSDKHFHNYRRLRSLYAPGLSSLRVAAMQTATYAARIEGLGAKPSVITVTGSTKFDGLTTDVDDASRHSLRVENGLPTDAPVILFGSTRPGDEKLAAACLVALRRRFAELTLIIAPRHLNRLAEALEPFDEPVLLRSEVQNGKQPGAERIFCLDTMGELAEFYRISDIAVIGGSFFAGVDGHNPLEPAALGIPTVFGPHMANFPGPAEALLECGGAVQVGAPHELVNALHTLLAEAEARKEMGARARDAVLAGQGAIERTLDSIAHLMESD